MYTKEIELYEYYLCGETIIESQDLNGNEEDNK